MLICDKLKLSCICCLQCHSISLIDEGSLSALKFTTDPFHLRFYSVSALMFPIYISLPMASGTFLCASQMKRKPSGVNIHLCYQLYHSFLYSSSFFLLLWVHLPCIKTTGFSRLPSTPQEQFLHRNGTLFNFAYFLYQTRYDYFDIDAIHLARIQVFQ